MIKKTWKEFQECKLLWWVNRSLHLFGWAIVLVENEDGAVTEVYPARVPYRGFPAKTEDEGFTTLTRYLAAESATLVGDVDPRQEGDSSPTEMLQLPRVAVPAGPAATNYSPPQNVSLVCADAVSAEAEAQRQANMTGHKWVWYQAAEGTFQIKPADVLQLVQLNDVVLAGEIVVLERPYRKEVYNLVWPVLS